METAVSTEVVTTTLDYLPHSIDPKAVEQALLIGDLSQMSDEVRIAYYIATCRSVGLNPLTKPFQALKGDDGKITLYPDKGCAEQLRKLHRVSVKVVGREFLDDLYIVTVQARTPDGREEEAQGVVSILKAKGRWEDYEYRGQARRRWKPDIGSDGQEVTVPLSSTERAIAIMRAETKAKRRVTLAICGLGMPDWEQEPGSQAHPMALTLQTPPVPDEAKPLAELVAEIAGEGFDPTMPTSARPQVAQERAVKNRQEGAQVAPDSTNAPKQGVKDAPKKDGLKNDSEGSHATAAPAGWRETISAQWEAFLTRSEGDDRLETIGLATRLEHALGDLTTTEADGQRLAAELRQYLARPQA